MKDPLDSIAKSISEPPPLSWTDFAKQMKIGQVRLMTLSQRVGLCAMVPASILAARGVVAINDKLSD